jgi:hypothetical protein
MANDKALDKTTGGAADSKSADAKDDDTHPRTAHKPIAVTQYDMDLDTALRLSGRDTAVRIDRDSRDPVGMDYSSVGKEATVPKATSDTTGDSKSSQTHSETTAEALFAEQCKRILNPLVNPESDTCVMCHERKRRDDFSKTQWTVFAASAGVRTCLQCEVFTAQKQTEKQAASRTARETRAMARVERDAGRWVNVGDLW